MSSDVMDAKKSVVIDELLEARINECESALMTILNMASTAQPGNALKLCEAIATVARQGLDRKRPNMPLRAWRIKEIAEATGYSEKAIGDMIKSKVLKPIDGTRRVSNDEVWRLFSDRLK